MPQRQYVHFTHKNFLKFINLGMLELSYLDLDYVIIALSSWI